MNITMQKILPVLTLLLLSLSLIAQPPHGRGHGPGGGMGPEGMPSSGIMGRVIDAQTKQPVEYANVALFNAEDSILVNGGITNDKGFFVIRKVKNGVYNMRIKFIGYKSHTVYKIEVTDENPLVRFRGIQLQPANVELDAVTVTAKQEEVVYKIDKRVVNVSENINTVGGTAVDALENTPGIEVDIDGNVSIRGSDNFTVLIDGKPTAMSGNDALQQIPASSIKEIEIITNPSAKYDPDGLTGILNIILKKDEKGGLNGQVSATVGTQDHYNAGVSLNYRKGKMNLVGGYDFRQGGRSGNSESLYKTYRDGYTDFRKEDGDRGHQRINHTINAGLDYDFDDKNFLSINGRFRIGERNRMNESFYYKYTDTIDDVTDYFSKGDNQDDETSYEISGSFIHRFTEEEHEIKIMASYSAEDENETAYTKTDSLAEVIFLLDETLTETTEKHQHGTFQVDYTLPIGSNKIEAGMKSSLRGITYNQTGDIINPVPGALSNEFIYNEGIHAVYAMLAGPLGGLEYQLGLRGEYSRVYTEQKSTNETNTKEIFTVYPTLHFSYEINKKNKFMAGYSRRVHRPRTYFLNPYVTPSDGFIVRKGNPDLDPEYAHSVEVNYLKYFENSFLNVTTFYRQTDNNIGRINVPLEGDTTLLTFENINRESSLGIEVSARHKFKKWVSLNASYSFFRYTIDGEALGEDLSNESMNHKIRANADIKIGRNIRLSAFGMYFSPSATSQGERESFYFTGFGYKHTFFDQKLTLSARIRNPFGNFQWKFTSRGSNFENEYIRRPDFPQFNVGLTYKFGEQTKRRKMNGEEGGTREDFNEGMTVD
jgi:outer membrane cobalamin receptor